MSTLRAKLERHWLSIICALVLSTASATSACWYWFIVNNRDILLSEKNLRISELEEKLRFALTKIESSERFYREKITEASTEATKLKISLTQTNLKQAILLEIKTLETVKNKLISQHSQHLASIDNLISEVATYESICRITQAMSDCKVAATARMTLEKEKNELSWVEKQIEKTNEQIVSLQTRI